MRQFITLCTLSIFLLNISCSSSSSSDNQEPTPTTPNVPTHLEISKVERGQMVSLSLDWPESLDNASLEWHFGDGQTAEGAQVAHYYEDAGTYTVTAKYVNAGGERSQDMEVLVTIPPSCDSSWKRVKGPQFNYGILDVVAGDPGLVAVGLDGVVRFSVDGIDWCEIPLYRREHFSKVLWLNDAFYAMGRSSFHSLTDGYDISFGLIIRSENGKDWDIVSKANSASHFATNGQTFVAAGLHLLYSEDAVQWQNVADTPEGVEQLFWTGTQYLAMGYDSQVGKPFLMTSPDGRAWEYASSGVETGPMASNGNRIVRVGNEISTSDNGFQWRTAYQPHAQLRDVTFGKNVFVSVGGDTILHSSDGLSWVEATIEGALTTELRKVVAVDQFFIAFSLYGPQLWSSDGLNWSASPGQKSPDAVEGWKTIAIADQKFVVAGDGGRILESEDGIEWVEENLAAMSKVETLASGPFGLLAAGYELNETGDVGFGKIWLRKAGTWRSVYTGETPIQALLSKGAYAIAIDANGQLLQSEDGEQWQQVSLAEDIAPSAQVALDADETHFYLGISSKILRSEDGKTWTVWGELHDFRIADLVCHEGNILMIGIFNRWYEPGTRVMKSADGQNWTELNTGFSGRAGYIARGPEDTLFLGNNYRWFENYPQSASSNAAAFYTSTDGEQWFPEPTSTMPQVRDTATKDGVTVIVSGRGMVLRREW